MEGTADSEPTINQCPECSKPLDVSLLPPFAKIDCIHCGKPVRVRTIMGQYEIIGLLGEGGMSQVFRAVDRHLGREVALKVLHQALSRDASLTAMFEREAKLTASIIHPNVVKVYSVGKDHGYFYIAMELVDANGVEKLIAESGAISEAEVLDIAYGVTSGLKAAHEEGLIHRDIKPGNMLVTGEGTTKLVDFGLAVQQGGIDESEDLWATPFYVPPEKLDGEQDTHLGDIYSLGATLYHAVAGKPPFEANTSSLEELKTIKKQPVDLKSEAPGASKPVIKLIESMMAYEPEARPASYSTLLTKLDELRDSQSSTVTRRPTKSKKKPVILAAGLCAVLALIVTIVALTSDRETPEGPSLGIGTGERVISAGEGSNAEKFLEARELLVSGNFQRAGKMFDQLSNDVSLSGSTKMWAWFFDGTSKLLTGKEKEARESFAKAKGATATPMEESPEIKAFLAEFSEVLSDPLPVMESEVNCATDSIEAVGWFLAGIKNWQQGEFSSGIKLFDRFENTTPPSDLNWIEDLKPNLEAFRSDFETWKTLPNPARKEGAATLRSADKELQRVAATLKTQGSLPELIAQRRARIADTLALIEEEKEEAALIAARSEEKAPVPDDTGEATDPAEDPRFEADIEKMRKVLSSFESYQETLLFAGAATRLEAEIFSSKRGQELQAALADGYEQAAGYLEVLAERLNSAAYEGIIRRKQGIPLEAQITKADVTAFTLDLGFGPNEVEIDAFANDWLIDAGIQVFGAPTAETAAEWEKLLFFGLATGNAERVRPLAEPLAAVSEPFAAKWEIVSVLLPE